MLWITTICIRNPPIFFFKNPYITLVRKSVFWGEGGFKQILSVQGLVKVQQETQISQFPLIKDLQGSFVYIRVYS